MTPTLTPRQQEVAKRIAAGQSCPRIAQDLGIHTGTVHRYVHDTAAILRASGYDPSHDFTAMKLVRKWAREQERKAA